jgi:hypothetical protein
MNAAEYALAGTLGGVALGFVGQAVLARQREQTERRLAQDARLSERRSALYERMLAAGRRQLTLIGHIHPLLEEGGAPAGPDDITLDEAIEIMGQIDIWSTRTVAEAHEAFTHSLRKFEGVVRTQRAIELQKTGREDSIGIGEPYVLIDTARTEVKDRYAELVVTVRHETNPQVCATGVTTRLRALLPSKTTKPPQ